MMEILIKSILQTMQFKISNPPSMPQIRNYQIFCRQAGRDVPRIKQVSIQIDFNDDLQDT